MHCADGEPQIFFFHVYHELFIKFSAILLLVHRKGVTLTQLHQTLEYSALCIKICYKIYDISD
jgi:hypothetical protein